MSGNFDRPSTRSTSSPSPLDPDNNPTSLIARLQAPQASGQLGTRSEQPNSNVQAPMPPRLRWPSRRVTENSSREGPLGLNNLPLPVSRPRAIPGERYQAMRRLRQQQQGQILENEHMIMAALEQTSRQLRQTNSELLQLVDHGNISQYLPPPSGPRPSLPPLDPESARRRTKRRKLDHSSTTSSFEGFSYGHFGQVVPGQLKMEIVSCDGGEYTEDSETTRYRAENVLRNDRSVYCTKTSKCNLLLRHQGGTTFSLDKLVVKAPKRGFTAPVQEGVVFVGMSSKEVLEQSEQYQFRRRPTPRSSSSFPDGEGLTLMESLHDPGVLAGLRQRQHERPTGEGGESDPRTQRRFEARTRRRLEDMHVTQSERHSYTDTNAEGFGDWPLTEHDPPIHDPNASTPPPFTISELTGDEASDGDGDEYLSDSPNTARPQSRYGDMRRAYQAPPGRSERRREHLDETDSESSPRATFFMEKSNITVRFLAPVSAKFVLLKLFSHVPNGNIDIQSVAAYGYAGPRFFPSCQMR